MKNTYKIIFTFLVVTTLMFILPTNGHALTVSENAEFSLSPSLFGSVGEISAYDEFNDLVETADGGYIGSIRANGDAKIVRFNATGGKVWQKTITGNSTVMPYGSAELTDGSIVTVITSSATDLGFALKGYYYHGVIVKLDRNGNEVWRKSLGGNKNDNLYAITATTDGGFIVGGDSNSSNLGFTPGASAYDFSDAILAKYDTNGNRAWIKNYGGNSLEDIKKIIQNADGTFTAVGNVTSTNLGLTMSPNGTAWIIKTSSAGVRQWWSTYSGEKHEVAYGLTGTSDGGFIMVGDSDNNVSHYSYDAFIVKYNSSGTRLWAQRFGPGKQAVQDVHAYHSAKQLPNGNIRAYGSNSSGTFYAEYNNSGTYLNSKRAKYNFGYKTLATKDYDFITYGNLWQSQIDTYAKTGIVKVPTVSGSPSFAKYTLDSDTPVLTVNYNTLPTNGNIVVNATATDMTSAGTVWLPGALFDNYTDWYYSTQFENGTLFKNSFVIMNNGTYTILARDGVDRIARQTLVITNIDRTPPADATFSSPPFGRDATVAITYPGDATIKQYKIGAGGTWQTYVNPVVLLDNNTIFARSSDAAGNWSNENSAVINSVDKINPTGSLTQNITGWTNGSIVITAVGTDTQSGMMRIKKPDGSFGIGSTTTYTVSTNGMYTFEFEDNANNKFTQNISISNIDTSNPTILLDQTTRDWESINIYVGLSFSDVGGSGHKESRYIWTNDTVKPTSGWSTWVTGAARTLEQPVEGMWYLHTEARDNAGNIAYQYGGVYKLDNSAPILNMDFSEILDEQIYSYIGQNKVNFKGSVSENNSESNVQVYYYVENDATGQKITSDDALVFEQANNVMDVPFEGRYRVGTTLKNGTYNLVVYAKNKVGLISGMETVSFEVANPTSKPSVNITIHPQPTGQWINDSIDTYITDSGDFDLLAGASKKYEVTNSSTYPTSFTKNLPIDRRVTIDQVGVNYLHVQYTLEDGTVISSTAGPYLVDKGDIGNFDVTLESPSGVEVTDWTNQDLTLVISDPSVASISGFVKQYRIDNYHTDWQIYSPGTKIKLEGNNRVFARIVTNAGTTSEQQFVAARIDKTKPVPSNIQLHITDNNLHNVLVIATDDLSGIQTVKLDTNQVLSASSNKYSANGLIGKPSNVTLTDRAGNSLDGVGFATEPNVTFDAPYTVATQVYRSDVKVNISGINKLSYKLGKKLIDCTANPCTFTLTSNSLLTAIQTEGYKQTTKAFQIVNLDKTPLKLLLNGERDSSDPTKITYKWNYEVTSGKLHCTEGGVNNTYDTIGTKRVFDGKNHTYDCHLEGTYGGESLISNRAFIYPDSRFDVEKDLDIKQVQKRINVYAEESMIGTSYFINAKMDNYKFNEFPLPENDVTRN